VTNTIGFWTVLGTDLIQLSLLNHLGWLILLAVIGMGCHFLVSLLQKDTSHAFLVQGHEMAKICLIRCSLKG
jgi:hypothetical protein